MNSGFKIEPIIESSIKKITNHFRTHTLPKLPTMNNNFLESTSVFPAIVIINNPVINILPDSSPYLPERSLKPPLITCTVCDLIGSPSEFIQPCLCPANNVHQRCLDISRTINDENFHQCLQCKYKYTYHPIDPVVQNNQLVKYHIKSGIDMILSLCFFQAIILGVNLILYLIDKDQVLLHYISYHLCATLIVGIICIMFSMVVIFSIHHKAIAIFLDRSWILYSLLTLVAIIMWPVIGLICFYNIVSAIRKTRCKKMYLSFQCKIFAVKNMSASIV